MGISSLDTARARSVTGEPHRAAPTTRAQVQVFGSCHVEILGLGAAVSPSGGAQRPEEVADGLGEHRGALDGDEVPHGPELGPAPDVGEEALGK